MRVDKLIALLSAIDGAAEVVIAGDADTTWTLEQVIDTDNGSHVTLVPGACLPDPCADAGDGTCWLDHQATETGCTLPLASEGQPK